MFLIELWGGPDDGKIIAMGNEPAQRIYFPVAPDVRRDPLHLRQAVFEYLGRRHQRLVYRWRGIEDR